MTSRRKYPEPKIRGTLEIGAGTDPYADTTVAVDEFEPMKPKRIPKGVGPIRMLVTESAIDRSSRGMHGERVDKYYRLNLEDDSRLRLYWVGNAADLPDEWNGKFSEVKSRNALGALEQSKFKEPYAVLKRGGKIYFLANGPGGMLGEGTQQDHINHVVSMLKKAGFVDVEVHEFDNKYGDTSFEARKPLRAVPRKKTKHISHKAPMGLRSTR